MKDSEMMDDLVDNVGIMQGFLDGLADEEDEYEDDIEDMPESDDAAEVMGRTPDSPEILMNNLRGDMQSIDARREELANMVGEYAAQETPNEVLALLQPMLAQGGIGGLPQMAPIAAGPQPPMMPPAGMPPMPPMPPGAPAEMMPPPPQEGGIAGLPVGGPPAGGPPPMPPPVQMRAGGLVQRFSDGSDEDGVTPADEKSSYQDIPQNYRDLALAEMNKIITSKPTVVPELKTLADEKARAFTEILGRDRSAADAQLLFQLGQRAFNYAANVDEQGRPLRGGALARLAGATRTLPSDIGKFISDREKEDRQIRLLGLESAAKDISAMQDRNVKLIESKRKVFSDILKSSKPGSGLFGGSLTGRALNIVTNSPDLIARWSVRDTTPEEDNLIASAITVLTQPRMETRQNPVSKRFETVSITPKLPDFLTQAIAVRGQLGAAGETRPAAPTGAGKPQAGVSGAPGVPATGEAPPRTIWSMSSNITGPINVAKGLIGRTPGLGGTFPDVTQAQNLASQEVENLIEAFIKNDRAAVSEQDRLRKLYQIDARFWDDPAALRDRLIAIDEELLREVKLAQGQAYNEELQPSTQAKARDFLSAAEKFRGNLGVPIRVYSQAELEKLAPGTQVLWQGKTPTVWTGKPAEKGQ
jgi:hypothetical protein